MADVERAIIRVHHEEWARVVASLTRRFGDLDIAEEAAAEAFATAVERWPGEGVPPNPGAWLTTTANRKAIDRIRRESKRDD
ncbi:MAG TPA: sigma factor, partial [Solirubrobacteraceae bacterium]